MVDFACLQAKELGAKTVLALSTQAFSFFTSVCDFTEAEKEVLPESRLKTYDESGRNSKILLKSLNASAPVREPVLAATTAS